MKTNIDKLKLYHQAKGSRVLDDAVKEKVAFLLSDPSTASDVFELLGVTGEQVENMKSDDLFRRRLAYLTKKRNRPRAKVPQSPSEYRDWALRQLHRIARKARHDKDRVSACKVLGIIAGELAKEKGSGGGATSTESDPEMEHLKRLMTEGDK